MRTIVDTSVKRIGAGRLAGLIGVVALAGCAAEDGVSDVSGAEDVATVQSALGTKQVFGTINQLGMRVTFTAINNPTNVDTTKITGLAACEEKVLYVVMPDATSTFSLYFSTDGGLSFTKVRAIRSSDGQLFDVAAKSSEIACDDHELMTMDANKQIFWAGKAGTNLGIGDPAGTDPWTASAAAPLVDHIQGGDGTIYGLKESNHTLYKSTTHTNGSYDLINWTAVSQIGSKMVSGGGSSNLSDTLAWPRRAFTTEPNGTVFFNDRILEGLNGWTGLDTGSERFSVLSVGTTTFLYGIDLTSGPRLVTVSTIETSCADGFDNDADGMKDSEDPDCYEAAAVAFCALPATLNGTYCVDRYQGTGMFLGQTPNPNTGLVTCSNHLVVPPVAGGPKVPKIGVCVRSGTRSDFLMSQSALAAPETGLGRWCNSIVPSTASPSSRFKWDFAFGGTNPCATVLSRTPGSVVVRAGLYSTGGENNVLANCNNGAVILRGIGSAPLQDTFNAVGHTQNACIFTASPSRIPVWTNLYPPGTPGAAAQYNHTYSVVDVPQFGRGEDGQTDVIDRFGFMGANCEIPRVPGAPPCDVREHAYDIFIPEGTPVFATAGGTVVWSADRDVTSFPVGSSYQGEMLVKYAIGSNSTYQETVATAYAHVRRRLVVEGQTVKAGQIVGYVGETGAAGGVHLHWGGIRLSNMNAHTTTQPQIGYHLPLIPSGTGQATNLADQANIDPLGWTNPSAPDPSGYADRNTDTGLGWLGQSGWSIDLFKDGMQPNI